LGEDGEDRIVMATMKQAAAPQLGARNTPFVTRADEHAEWNWIFTFPYRSWLSFYETSRARVTKWTLGPPVGFGFPDYKENGLAVSPKGHGGPRVYR
jgi:hypothetical protein